MKPVTVHLRALPLQNPAAVALASSSSPLHRRSRSAVARSPPEVLLRLCLVADGAGRCYSSHLASSAPRDAHEHELQQGLNVVLHRFPPLQPVLALGTSAGEQIPDIVLGGSILDLCCVASVSFVAMDGGSTSKRTVDGPPEGGSGSKRLNVSIGVDTLDCPICFEPLRPPVFQCSVGHFICSCCHGKQLDKKCHICSTRTSFERCFGMEHVVQSVTVPCCNATYGCAEKVTYYQKEEHAKGCRYAPCFCPESGCSFAGLSTALLGHFTTQHKCPLTTLPDSDMDASLRLQPGLNILQCTETSYFFLFSMALEPFGHAISVVCVQPHDTETKFSCTMNYDSTTTGYLESTSCYIRSSSLSDGLPTGYDLILPKGKISDDRNVIMLRTTIHRPLSPSSFLRGKGLTPPIQRSPCSETDEEDNIPLIFRSRLRGNGPAPARQQRRSHDTSDDDSVRNASDDASDDDVDDYYDDDNDLVDL